MRAQREYPTKREYLFQWLDNQVQSPENAPIVRPHLYTQDDCDETEAPETQQSTEEYTYQEQPQTYEALKTMSERFQLRPSWLSGSCSEGSRVLRQTATKVRETWKNRNRRQLMSEDLRSLNVYPAFYELTAGDSATTEYCSHQQRPGSVTGSTSKSIFVCRNGATDGGAVPTGRMTVPSSTISCSDWDEGRTDPRAYS